MDVSGYIGLFGESGLALSAAQWVEHADANLTPNLSALNARYLEGSRDGRFSVHYGYRQTGLKPR